MPVSEPYAGNEPYIFLSYATADYHIVMPIIEQLQRMGVRLWYNRYIYYAYFAEKVAEELENCCIYVSFLSKNFYASKHCRNELHYAHKNKKQILNVYLKDEPMPNEMVLLYSSYQSIFKFNCKDDHAFYQSFMETENISQCIIATSMKFPVTETIQFPRRYIWKEPYIFISFARKDSDIVLPIIMQLKKSDVRLWYDDRTDPDPRYRRKISTKLAECSIYVPFLSQNFFDSRICKDELYFALDNNKQILNIYLENEPMPHRFAVLYDTYQSICKDDPAFYQKFLRTENIAQCIPAPSQDSAPAQTKEKFFLKQAKRGNAEAQCMLGVYYAFGDGVAKDMDKAIFWYQKAAEQGYTDAQCLLASCYIKGEGVEQNYDKGLFWYHKAVELGNADAAYMLGLIYEEGVCGDPDFKKAVEWYEKGMNMGNKSCESILKELKYSGLI